MPVQIPSLKRIDPATPVSIGQDTVQSVDEARAFAPIAKGINQLGNTIVQEIEKAENETAGIEGVKVNTELSRKGNTIINGDSETGKLGLIHEKGDPTVSFNNADDTMDGLIEEVRTRYKNHSRKTRQSIERGILTAKKSYDTKRLTAYGSRRTLYHNEIFDAAIQQRSDDAVKSVGLYDSTKPIEFRSSHFTENIKDLKNLIVSKALSEHRAQRVDVNANEEDAIYYTLGEEGGKQIKIQLDQHTAQEMSRVVSQTLFKSISTLLSEDQIDLAKITMLEFDEQIDPVDRIKLNKKFKNGTRKQKALELLAKISGMSFKEKRKFVRITDKDSSEQVEIKRLANGFLDNDESLDVRARARHENEIFDDLSLVLDEKMNSKEPYDSFSQFENSKEHSSSVDELPQKRKNDLRKMIERPETSSPEVEQGILQKIRNNTLHLVKPQEIQNLLIGLNKSDSTYYRNKWIEANKDTTGEKRARNAQLRKEFYNFAIGAELLEINVKNNRPKRESLIKFNSFMRVVGDEFDNIDKNASNVEILRFVETNVARELKRRERDEEFFGDKIKRGVISFQTVRKFEQKRTTPTETAGEWFKSLKKDQLPIVNAYKKDTGKTEVPDMETLKKWFDERN